MLVTGLGPKQEDHRTKSTSETWVWLIKSRHTSWVSRPQKGCPSSKADVQENWALLSLDIWSWLGRDNCRLLLQDFDSLLEQTKSSRAIYDNFCNPESALILKLVMLYGAYALWSLVTSIFFKKLSPLLLYLWTNHLFRARKAWTLGQNKGVNTLLARLRANMW